MSNSAISGPIFTDNKRAPAGTAAAPSFAFNDSTGTGVYLVSPGVLGLSTAGVQRVVVDASGNVGIGTGSPTNKLQVSGSGSTYMAVNSINAGSGAGLYMTNSTNSYLIGAGAASGGSGLEFRDVTNSTTRMTLDASGNLLVGTASVSSNARLTLKGTGTAFGVGPLSTSPNNFFVVDSGGTGVYLATGATSWTANSDERLKDIIEPIADAAKKVSTLRAVIGKYKTDEEGTRRAFLIAQDVQAVLPEAVDANDSEKLGVRYTDTVPLLVAAIQELKAELDEAKAKIAALEAK